MTQSNKPTVLLTGGAGFIGGHVVERLIGSGYGVVNIDLLTYAGNLRSLSAVAGHDQYKFVKGDICDRRLVAKLLAEYKPLILFNIAAESHVDRSIEDSADFIKTNINGVCELLECSLPYWRSLEGAAREDFRFIQMSTDEVYGSISEGKFTVDSNYAPNSPYAASKAAGDHMVRAYNVTHGLPTITVHASNTYGPRQYPEKLIPHMILSALNGSSLPVYGDGKNVRDWMHVNDLVAGLERVVCRGQPGEVYNFSGCDERSNLDTVKLICATLNQLSPGSQNYQNNIVFVKDRPGHDFRYAMSATEVKRKFGWTPTTSFEMGLSETVAWYLANRDWCQEILERGYKMSRIGSRP